MMRKEKKENKRTGKVTKVVLGVLAVYEFMTILALMKDIEEAKEIETELQDLVGFYKEQELKSYRKIGEYQEKLYEEKKKNEVR